MKTGQANKNSTSLSTIISSATLHQLSCALKNLKGGKKHVLTLVGHHSFQELLQEGKIQPHDSYLYADIEEKSGNAIRMVITVSTSGLGIWMGLADLLANGYRSWQQLIYVSAASIFIGFLISFLSYHFAAKRAKESALQKKLINLQIIFLNNMIEKVEKKYLEAKNDLYQDLSKLDNNLIIRDYISFFEEKNKRKSSKKGQYILATLRQKIENELDSSTATSLFSQYLFEDIFKQLKKIILLTTKNITANCFFTSKEGRSQQKNVKLLFKFPRHFTKSKMTFLSWLMDSSLGIFLEAIPVFVGTFGAIFLFLNGLPDTFKKLGYENITAYLDNPWVKYGNLTLAILFVFYLGASQVKFSYKSYLRTKNIEEARSEEAEKEVKYYLLHRQYILINKFSKVLRKLLNMLTLSQAVKK